MQGFNEEGTTTTPFDMVVKNEMSRYHLCLDALKSVAPARSRAARSWSRTATEMLDRHRQYVVEHLDDMPEVRDWTWSPA